MNGGATVIRTAPNIVVDAIVTASAPNVATANERGAWSEMLTDVLIELSGARSARLRRTAMLAAIGAAP